MTPRTRIGFGVAAAVLVLAAYAVSTTMATKVTPTATKTKASLITNTKARFQFGNAKSKEAVRCDKSSFETESPAAGANEDNINRKGTGTYSLGEGDVRLVNTKPPVFEDCNYYVFNGTIWENKGKAPITVSGAWSAKVRTVKVGSVGWPQITLTMPASGIEIKFGDRVLKLPAKAADSVTGPYFNETGNFGFDSQLLVEENGADTILQFEAGYTLSTKLKVEL